MINRALPGFLTVYLFLSLFLPFRAKAQFIDLSLDIEPEVTARVERNLDFGILTVNMGRRTVNLGDINMGVFSITALEGQELLVDLNKPEELIHNNPAVRETMPLELFVRYSYTNTDYRNSTLMPASVTSILVRENPDVGPWNTIYLFIYGSVNVGNIPEGSYTNDLVLYIEYI